MVFEYYYIGFGKSIRMNGAYGNGHKWPMNNEADRKLAMETIRQIEKPVVAYKILGAARLRAADGFEQAFNAIKRKDGVCVGIWAKEAIEQIRENATLTEMLTSKAAG